MSYARGWNKGLKEGLFGSGFVLGTVAPIAVVLSFIVGACMALNRCFDTGPGRCRAYSYETKLLGSSTMTCDQWPAMEMRIEKRIVRSSIVHCTCTAASDVAEEAEERRVP